MIGALSLVATAWALGLVAAMGLCLAARDGDRAVAGVNSLLGQPDHRDLPASSAHHTKSRTAVTQSFTGNVL